MAGPTTHQVNFFFGDFGRLNYYRIAEDFLGYVNRCFDKNTNRYFTVNRVAQKVTVFPESGGYPLTLPRRFSVDVYVRPRGEMGGAGGNNLAKENGDGVVIIAADASDFTPVNSGRVSLALLHEMGHVFGVGIGEYSKLAVLVDLTQAGPELKVSIRKPDNYWSSPQRSEWAHDPILNIAATVDPTWSPLSALVINYGMWRTSGPPTPELSTVTVVTPFIFCDVEIYRSSLNGCGLTGEFRTSTLGYLEFPWGSSPSDAVSWDQFRKFVFRTDKGPVALGLSIFDVQEAWLKACERLGVIGTDAMFQRAYLAKVC